MVSVVIPVYNVEKYLNNTIDCVLNQTYKDYELLLIDDGSTDSSGKICDTYAQGYDNIRVFHNQNQGPAKTRNFGIENAKGEYVAFIDSDDLIRENYLQAMMEGYQQEEVDLAMCGYERFDSETNETTSTHLVKEEEYSVLESNRELARLFTTPRTSLNGVSIWAKIYKRNILMDYNIRFPENIDYEEDCCMNVQYYRHVRKTYIVNKSLYRYRQLKNSLSKVYKETTYANLVNGYNERMKFIKEFPNNKKLCDGVNVVFLVVTMGNLKKIEASSMNKKEKLQAYDRMLKYAELHHVIDNCALSKNKLTKNLTLACKTNNPKKIQSVFRWWNLKVKLRSIIKKK